MPYPMFGQLWPIALLLLLMCAPKRIRRTVGAWLRILGFAVGLLLVIPYLLAR